MVTLVAEIFDGYPGSIGLPQYHTFAHATVGIPQDVALFVIFSDVNPEAWKQKMSDLVAQRMFLGL